MKIDKFMEEFDYKRTTLMQLINRSEYRLPAYKQGGSWFIDLDEFYKWREDEHARQYKYA